MIFVQHWMLYCAGREDFDTKRNDYMKLQIFKLKYFLVVKQLQGKERTHLYLLKFFGRRKLEAYLEPMELFVKTVNG